jgi:hypothetical protein
VLTRKQWLWCAEHHRPIKITTIALISFLLLLYSYLFLERWWAQGKAPPVFHPQVSQAERFDCRTKEVEAMRLQYTNPDGLVNPDPLYQRDARPLHLEFHRSSMFGSEILDKRPECLGAYIADMQHYPEPYAILIVDRKTGKTIFRIAKLDGYLTR